MNAINPLKFTFHKKNWENYKIDKTSILPNFQVPNEGFFGIIVKKFRLIYSFEKEDTLVLLLSAWDRSRDPTAKRNLSKDM